MKEFFTKIWMKVRSIAKRAWDIFTPAGRTTFAIILLCIIALGVYATYNHKNDKKNNSKPEVVENGLHPSIGEALAPDVKEQPGTKVTATVGPESNSGTVAGAETTEVVTMTTPTTEKKIAPKTGVDIYDLAMQPRGPQ